MLRKSLSEALKRRTFINVASCDLSGRPNGVSKFILKFDSHSIHLVDYSMSRTYSNLKVNPRVSLSFFDTENLLGYQINGPVEVIEEGKEYEQIASELHAREISLSTERIIKGVNTGRKHQHFELAPKRFVIFKVTMEEVAEVTYSGEIRREKTS